MPDIPANSSVPNLVDLMQYLLRALKALGGSGSNDEIDTKSIEIMALPEEVLTQMHEPRESSKTEVAYRLSWARTYLKKLGMLENSSRGIWSLTEKGQNTERVDSAEVFQLQRNASRQRNINIPASEEPERNLVDEENWKTRLSTVLTNDLTPAAFERLIQRVLRESGFIHVEVTGKTGDGGIDGKGIARIHGFMSFHVLFQCKRYRGNVGSSEIRDFRGAMVGRADKGLFITTGFFTPAATREATRDGAPPIDLVDGDDLAEKLKDLQLGIKTELVEQVSVDANWFKNL